MSSSRRSSRTERERAGRCPLCGKNRVVRTEEDVVLHIGRRRYRFEHVAHERCLTCGERVFDIDASKRFDAILKRRGRRAA